MKKLVFGLASIIVIILLLGIFRSSLVDIDAKYLNFALKDIYVSIFYRTFSEDNIQTDYDNHRLESGFIESSDVIANPISSRSNNDSWITGKEFIFIGHRGGNVALTGENTIATLEKNKRWFDFFEVDLFLTSDGDLLLYHHHSLDRGFFRQLKNENAVSTEELRTLIRKRGWVPATLDEAVKRLDDNQFLVLDVKTDFKQTMAVISRKFSENEKLRLIPQIYDFGQIESYNVGDFGSPIFTSYRSSLSSDEIFGLARTLNVKAITLTKYRVEKVLNIPDDLMVFTHAVDSFYEAYKFKAKGIDGFYTKVFNAVMFPEFSADQSLFRLEHYDH